MSKDNLTVQVSSDILNRIKNAVYWTPGMTLASCVGIALEKEVTTLEEQNSGKFPQRPENLKSGRPIK